MSEIRQVFIPSKIKVGFQKREGTYTGKLAYVTYFDLKGVLRKQNSWEGWRHKDIEPIEYENVPTEGFVLNKDVGGARRSYGWNARIEKVRVYDPRDFEFEISIPNLLFILKEGDCSRGKGLEGKFVYSWDGTELVLLPVVCQEYQHSISYTKLQGQDVKARELIKGGSYITKQQQKLIYLDKMDRYLLSSGYREPAFAKMHVFQDEKGGYVFLKDTKSLATCVSDTVVPDYAERIDAYVNSHYGSKVLELFLKKVNRKTEKFAYDFWAYEEKPGIFVQCSTNFDDADKTKIKSIQTRYRVYKRDDGTVSWDYHYSTFYPPDVLEELRKQHATSYAGAHYSHYVPDYLRPGGNKYVEPTQFRVFAKFENGAVHQVGIHSLISKQEAEDGEENG